MHTSWKGHLRLSLVSVPVAAVSARQPDGRPLFHQVHVECHNRIRYTKTCPVHGEVPKEEIVSAFEYAKGQYVLFDKDELAVPRGERERAINIEVIVAPGTVGPLFFTERSYYLVPDGKSGAKPYALLRECLQQGKLEAICQGVLFGGQELALLRADDDLLTLTALKFDAQVRDPQDLKVPKEPPFKKEELALTKSLLETFRNDKFDISNYVDHFAQEVAKLTQAKVKGKKVIKAATEGAPKIINLMDALKKSLAADRSGSAKTSSRKVARRKSG
jgi:DNA end-binding protein Ku